MTTSEKLIKAIRDVPDFPKPGILFKDITPIFQNPKLCREITIEYASKLTHLEIDVIAGIESRGFLFGLLLAQELQKPFVLIRKSGKLPYKTISEKYGLEYGTAEIEMHIDAIKPNQKVLIHDDLLATGGTAEATAKLIQKMNGEVEGFTFLVQLDFLKGVEKLKPFSQNIISLAHF